MRAKSGGRQFGDGGEEGEVLKGGEVTEGQSTIRLVSRCDNGVVVGGATLVMVGRENGDDVGFDTHLSSHHIGIGTKL